ncbi:MAG: CRTAC1 family protein [Candidatus Marinimicrobia bacterium]|nr:CRTAC1 family protein [Candidatus Neomarinimicrobiota bacterium]
MSPTEVPEYVPARLSRRRRRLITTTFGVSSFIIIVSVTIWLVSQPDRPYIPGEEIEGLTAELERAVPENYPKVTFADVAHDAGISFRHFSAKRTSQLPEDMGSGAAWGDYNNDGWIDLFVANEVGPLTFSEENVAASPAHCALYHNNGDGTFKEVSADVGVDFRGWAMAPTWNDYNNDGWLDLFLSCFGKNVLYHNNGDGTFSDKTSETGLGGRHGFWTGASWSDFNRDGFIDLYVCGYVQYVPNDNQTTTLQYDVEVPTSINPSSFHAERNLLYQNNGDGSFTEMSEKAGVEDLNGRSLSAAWCDFDEDGWPDLYVANDVSDNVLFRNRGDGTFEEISHSAYVADYRGAMGIAVGDWDGDTDMDMYITHWLAQENALYSGMMSELSHLEISSNKTKFMDEADRYGLGQIALDFIGFGTSFFDYDNDGWLDLFVANGSTVQQKEKSWLLIPMRDQLFWNRPVGEGFFDVSAVSGEVLKSEYVGRGAAFGDYDNDGDVDIFIVNNDGPGQLMRNDGGNRNRWLQVQLVGAQSNRQAIGAKLRLVAGSQVQLRQVGAQSSYLSQNSMIESFGLGSVSKADTLEIIWPSGLREEFYDVASRQTLHIVEGENPL